MTELEKLGWGQVFIVETLFQVAEEYDCMVDNFRFFPTNGGQQLLFNLNGNIFRWIFPLSEIEDCAEGGVFKDQILSNRAKIKQRFRKLLMLHKRVIPLGDKMPGQS
jgi:hypothetical protein